MWDLNQRTWKIPAKLVKRLSIPGPIVQLKNGRTLRRNRHQLQARPDGVTEISLEEEDNEVLDENRFRENGGDVDRMDRQEKEEVNGEIDENGTEEDGENPAEGTQEVEVEAQEQRQGVVTATRSGRVIKAPTWRKDYV